MILYDALTPWYPLLDPVEDHRSEAESYLSALLRGVDGDAATLLDLGAGAGNNAWHLKRRLRCALTDLSEPMLALSRAQNPECEHLVGDMRSLRLGRLFDAVLVHDAVTYMTTEEELAAVAATAFVHTRPGGAAVFAPDDYRDDYAPSTEIIETDDGDRALRCLVWSHDPDPSDTTTRTEYVLALREGEAVTVHHDRHVEGLFPRATWERVLRGAGYAVEWVERVDEEATGQVLLCRRPR